MSKSLKDTTLYRKNSVPFSDSLELLIGEKQVLVKSYNVGKSLGIWKFCKLSNCWVIEWIPYVLTSGFHNGYQVNWVILSSELSYCYQVIWVIPKAMHTCSVWMGSSRPSNRSLSENTCLTSAAMNRYFRTESSCQSWTITQSVEPHSLFQLDSARQIPSHAPGP